MKNSTYIYLKIVIIDSKVYCNYNNTQKLSIVFFNKCHNIFCIFITIIFYYQSLFIIFSRNKYQ